MDFLGDPTASPITSNSYNFRLRKAYAQFAGFTVGQDWSTFADLLTFPETVDRNGPIGNCQIRQPLVRYSSKLSKDYVLDLALENPESEFITPNGTMCNTSQSTKSKEYIDNIKGENRMPDLAAAIKYNFDAGYLRVAAIARRNSILDRSNGRRSDIWGGAIMASVLYKVLQDDAIVAQVTYGAGAGRYFTDAMAAATYYDGTNLHNQKEYHGSIGYKHQWNKTYNVRSSVAVGYVHLVNCDMLKDRIKSGVIGTENASTINKHLMSIHMNLMGNINERTQVGLEYIIARRKAETNTSGTLRRLTLAVQLNF
jgi:hypothetical protein